MICELDWMSRHKKGTRLGRRSFFDYTARAVLLNIEHFDLVATLLAKHEGIARKRILAEVLLNQKRQAVEAGREKRGRKGDADS